jgi:hypothetical protein
MAAFHATTMSDNSEEIRLLELSGARVWIEVRVTIISKVPKLFQQSGAGASSPLPNVLGSCSMPKPHVATKINDAESQTKTARKTAGTRLWLQKLVCKRKFGHEQFLVATGRHESR